MNEFLPIPGFPGYDISPTGEVRCWVFRGDALVTPRPQIPYLTEKLRWAVKLYQEDAQGVRTRTTASLPILLLTTFRGNPGAGEIYEVDFIDNDPRNINLENLRWKKS